MKFSYTGDLQKHQLTHNGVPEINVNTEYYTEGVHKEKIDGENFDMYRVC